jgi:chromosome segregation ATPase
MKDQLAQITATRKDAESLLSQALETVKAKDVTIKELEENLSGTVTPLKAMISEQQAVLKSREEELQTLRFEVQTLNAQLSEMNSVRLANLSLEQTPVEDRSKNLDEELRKILALENLMREKEELLLRHGEKIERLEVELKEKRTALAKYEITAWQGYERRVLWKQRLAKFGINIKDREL